MPSYPCRCSPRLLQVLRDTPPHPLSQAGIKLRAKAAAAAAGTGGRGADAAAAASASYPAPSPAVTAIVRSEVSHAAVARCRWAVGKGAPPEDDGDMTQYEGEHPEGRVQGERPPDLNRISTPSCTHARAHTTTTSGSNDHCRQPERVCALLGGAARGGPPGTQAREATAVRAAISWKPHCRRPRSCCWGRQWGARGGRRRRRGSKRARKAKRQRRTGSGRRHRCHCRHE
jgi:hypothetical protein